MNKLGKRSVVTASVLWIAVVQSSVFSGNINILRVYAPRPALGYLGAQNVPMNQLQDYITKKGYMRNA